MEQREIEKAIAELEERVDRLRALYEQYFLGFEKLEPSVVRKDVDRRFALLRKENMRNTAIRFRFNVVTQKYNTYAMHWTRICRQIEEGTFKRHIRRAKERFGDASAPAARDRDRPDASFDVDLDFEELEDVDIDELLGEADDRAATHESAPRPPPAAAPLSPPLSAPLSDRVARAAAVPAGARPILVRKVLKAAEPTTAAASSNRMPVVPSAPSSARVVPAAPVRPPQPSTPRIGVPATGAPARPMIRPMHRPPSPSQPELGPSSKPRLPLPSQIGREDED